MIAYSLEYKGKCEALLNEKAFRSIYGYEAFEFVSFGLMRGGKTTFSDCYGRTMQVVKTEVQVEFEEV